MVWPKTSHSMTVKQNILCHVDLSRAFLDIDKRTRGFVWMRISCRTTRAIMSYIFRGSKKYTSKWKINNNARVRAVLFIFRPQSKRRNRAPKSLRLHWPQKHLYWSRYSFFFLIFKLLYKKTTKYSYYLANNVTYI